MRVAVIILLLALPSCVASNQQAQDPMQPFSLTAFMVREDSLVITGQMDYYRQFSINEVLAAWRIDSNACKKIRNSLMAEYLVTELDIRSKSAEEIVMLLGEPNKIHQGQLYDLLDHEHTVHYIYIFDTGCINGQINEKSDKCWIDIICDPETGRVLHITEPCS